MMIVVKHNYDCNYEKVLCSNDDDDFRTAWIDDKCDYEVDLTNAIVTYVTDKNYDTCICKWVGLWCRNDFNYVDENDFDYQHILRVLRMMLLVTYSDLNE